MLKGNVQTLILRAAKQLQYFLHPTTEKIAFQSLKFSFFVLTMLPKAQCSAPAPAILFAWVSSFSFPFALCVHLMELQGHKPCCSGRGHFGMTHQGRTIQGRCRGGTRWAAGVPSLEEEFQVALQPGRWVLLALGGGSVGLFRPLQAVRGGRDPVMTSRLFSCHMQALLKWVQISVRASEWKLPGPHTGQS